MFKLKIIPKKYEKTISGQKPKTRKYWLVDLENTGDRWTQFITKFGPDDTVAIFYSSNAHRIDIAPLGILPGLHFAFIECGNGSPNALDFQLALWLGHTAANDPEASFAIISGDAGYKPLIGFLDRLGSSLECLAPKIQEPAPALMPKPKDHIREAYQKKLAAAGISDKDDLRILVAIFTEAMKKPPNKRKNDIRNRLMARYGAADGNLRYVAIKDVVHDIAEKGPWPAPENPKIEKRFMENGALTQSINTSLGQAKIGIAQGVASRSAEAVLTARKKTCPEKYLAESAKGIFPKKDLDAALEVLKQYI